MLLTGQFTGLARVALVALAALAAVPASASVCVGSCGILGADGDVTLSPLGHPYRYVTTDGGLTGVGSLGVGTETNGSTFTTSSFNALAGDSLVFYFNFVTSDGASFADYGWSQLQQTDGSPVATLFTARTTTSGDTVPGFGLPGLLATLSPSTTPIIAGGPVWSPLGINNASPCYDVGCGYTGWIKSTYTIAHAGTYQLAFGVTNWDDTAWQTGMAFDGISVAGNPVDDVPEPASWAMMVAGFGLVGAALRRRSTVEAA